MCPLRWSRKRPTNCGVSRDKHPLCSCFRFYVEPRNQTRSSRRCSGGSPRSAVGRPRRARDVHLHRAALRSRQSCSIDEYRPLVVAEDGSGFLCVAVAAGSARARSVLRDWRHGVCPSPRRRSIGENRRRRLFPRHAAACRREIAGNLTSLDGSRRPAFAGCRFELPSGHGRLRLSQSCRLRCRLARNSARSATRRRSGHAGFRRAWRADGQTVSSLLQTCSAGGGHAHLRSERSVRLSAGLGGAISRTSGNAGTHAPRRF